MSMSRTLLPYARPRLDAGACWRCACSFLDFNTGPRPVPRQRRRLQIDSRPVPRTEHVPLRKQLKEEAKARKLAGNHKAQTRKDGADTERLQKWELTVGIEIHAELNTTRKLFSPAHTSLVDAPNTHVAPFDAALPGAQPQFQKETLVPALRAAIALGCEVQKKSSWDRKHYFWWDQPNGYQITQYYEPFAKNGKLVLYDYDDIDPADGQSITIGIKQVQMEQDTAKTILQPPSTHLLDFNRVSHPLIEIISLPHIHSPKTAAAFVRKVQSILKAVGANTTGMELGGLRADVNVSVRRRDGDDTSRELLSYGGVTGLGQRTEIKNLSSFKAVEDAIVAERNRQVAVLEAGGVIEGETRGWSLGSTETRRLRGKEGEVDYRYMPDPDLAPVLIADSLLTHLRTTLPALPDENLALLTAAPYALTQKDAKTLSTIDDGDRLAYYLDLVDLLHAHTPPDSPAGNKAARTAANWLLHDLPATLAPYDRPWSSDLVAPDTLAAILTPLLDGAITLPTAKSLLSRALADAMTAPSTNASEPAPWTPETVSAILDAENLRLTPLSDDEYAALARLVVDDNGEMADKARADAKRPGKERGKVMWFVGQMVRRGEEGRVQPERAEGAVREALGL